MDDQPANGPSPLPPAAGTATAEPSPRPWRYEWLSTGGPLGHMYLIDANGKRIGALWGATARKVANCDLILEAVNGPEEAPHG